MATATPAADLTTVSMGIEGMTCEACAIHVKNALAKVPGVLDVSVSYVDRHATLTFDVTDIKMIETQIVSSQRTTTGCSSTSGATLNSSRTSR